MEVIQLSFWSKLIIRYPKWVILLVVLLTATFLYGCTLIKVNTDITSSIPENLPVKQFYNQVGELFPNQDFFVIGIQHDDTILNPSSLEKIQNLTESLFQLPEVDDVLNILNAQIVTGENDALVIRSVLENPLTGEEKLPANKVEILDFQKQLNKSEMGDGLISEDKKASIILVSLLDGYKNMGSDQGKISLEEKINQVVSAFKGPEKIYFSGQPIVSDLLGRYMSRDFMLLFPLSILVVLLIFFFSFRSLRGVLLPVAVVILGVIWTMGTTGFLNIPFSPLEILKLLMVAQL
jgi:predicted RND superfamily exporter protein